MHALLYGENSMIKIALFLSLCVFCCCLDLHAHEKKTVCLNMIVKNEHHVIRRCLDSVRPFIDYWVIVDTGSSDGTQEMIRSYMRDIPGELYERPWKNFGENRNEALQLAKGKADYILFMDADDMLKVDENFSFPPLTHDLYTVWRVCGDFSFQNHQLIKSSLPWRWVGVVHEYLECDCRFSSASLEHVKYVVCGGGASHSDPKKFFRYIQLLEDGLKREPNNSRYVFYLGESCRDAGEKAKAIEWYEKRIAMGGWAEEEIFWSTLQVACLQRELNYADDVVISSYYRAHRLRPHRVEPIYYLAELYNQRKNFALAYSCIKSRDFIPKPPQKDYLFNMDWMEKYGLLFELSLCSYYLGYYQESLNACDALLSMKDLPKYYRQLTESNRQFPLQKLFPSISSKKSERREWSSSRAISCSKRV